MIEDVGASDVMCVGDLVKPARPTGTWRLGVVEAIDDAGACKVRAYVAPPNSYARSAATYPASELVVVPRDVVQARLAVVRAEAAASALLADQIVEALAAADVFVAE